MSLAGTRLGPYEVIARLGAGGMGEVYRARDTALGRDVAIKILPASFAADPERLARFAREARVLASLNHPHIGQIYGIDESGGVRALVLEFVAGATLAEHIARRRGSGLGIAESLAIARQVADALDAAHERGIVHRDLKPANIVITPDGVVKVLDFGLAKPGTEQAEEDEGLTNSPTMIGPTRDGVVLGTAPYMSPEQARGKPVDKRADIWAFGCVVYEMLTGRAAFAGETTSDTVAAILEHEPEWAALPAETPSHISQLLRRCLAKDPKRRVRDIGDARLDLEARASDSSADQRLARARTIPVAAWSLAVVALIAASSLGTWAWMRRTHDVSLSAREAAVLSIDVPVPAVGPAALAAPGVALSRDGRSVAWVASAAEARSTIWTYAMNTGETRELPGTEGAANPFWSPDGRSLGFLAQGALRIIDLASGSVRSLANLPEVAAGGTWNADNIIVFSARYALYQIPASGGTPALVAEMNRSFHENSLRYPKFLPDGRHFLYVARSGRPQQSGAYVGSLDGNAIRLFDTTSHVEYAPPGYLLYASDGALIARTFDPRTLAVGPERFTIATRIGADAGGMNGHFDVSDTGVLAYFQRSTTEKAVLRWFDRSGRPLDAINEPAEHANFRIAPDGVRVAVDLGTDRHAARDVWVLNPAGAAPTRVTFGGSDDWIPFWSPDGRKVAFMSYRNGVGNLYVKTLGTADPEQPLLVSDEQTSPGDWSPDGKYIAYWSERADTHGDVWVLPLEGARASIAIARTGFNERKPRWSPDGRFLAYESDESGVPEIYVQPFPPSGGKWQVSVGGGSEAAWRGDGRELFYVSTAGTLLAVPVTLSSAGFSTGAPKPLFAVGRRGGFAGTSRYDVAPDGQRFLVRTIVDPKPQPITVVLNWLARLKK